MRACCSVRQLHLCNALVVWCGQHQYEVAHDLSRIPKRSVQQITQLNVLRCIWLNLLAELYCDPAN